MWYMLAIVVIYVNERETDQLQRKMTKGGVSPKT